MFENIFFRRLNNNKYSFIFQSRHQSDSCEDGRVGLLQHHRAPRARGEEGDQEGGSPQVQLLHLRERPGAGED